MSEMPEKTLEGMYFCILRSVFGGMCFWDATPYFQIFKEFVGKGRDTRWEETSLQCFLRENNFRILGLKITLEQKTEQNANNTYLPF